MSAVAARDLEAVTEALSTTLRPRKWPALPGVGELHVSWISGSRPTLELLIVS